MFSLPSPPTRELRILLGPSKFLLCLWFVLVFLFLLSTCLLDLISASCFCDWDLGSNIIPHGGLSHWPDINVSLSGPFSSFILIHILILLIYLLEYLFSVSFTKFKLHNVKVFEIFTTTFSVVITVPGIL
jgi:hypothetical protein